MRLTHYDGFNFEANGYSAGIPTTPVFRGVFRPNIITRPGSTPVFGQGSYSEITIPAEFIYNGSETYETAWAKLVSVLTSTGTSGDISKPKTLTAIQNDGTVVTISAVAVVPQQFDAQVNSLYVQFVSVDSGFVAQTASTASASFSGTISTALQCGVVGTAATPAKVSVTPTVAATSGWKYRKRYILTSTVGSTVSRYPWALNLGDTSTLVTASKMLASGNDVRVLIGGAEVQRTLVDFNVSGTDTLCWIILENLPANGTRTIDVIYGNSSAGAPPTLAYPNQPAFDIATTGANRSTNASWKYKVDTVAANAAKGGWYIDSGSAPPLTVSTETPGSWRLVKTLAATTTDDFYQNRYSSYTDTLTYYMGRFDSTRAKYGTITDTVDNRINDGVRLVNPLGMTAVTCDLKILNQAQTTTGTTGIGKVMILYKNTDGDNWAQLYENKTLYSTTTTVASATYTIPNSASVNQLAFAVWPYNGTSIPASATVGQRATASWGGTLTVAVSSSKITQNTPSETAVYELRAKFRMERDGSDSISAHMITLGNYSGATGVGTPHLLVPLNQTVEITNTNQAVRVMNGTTVVEQVPNAAFSFLAELMDIDGNTTEGSASLLNALLLRPADSTKITNPSFSVNASNWSRVSATSGITASNIARDTSTYSSGAASGKMQITASTAASGSSVVDVASDYISVGSYRRISFGASVRTDTVNLKPRLTILWYTAANALISQSTQDDWSPAANTWYRRVYSALAPSGAVYARVGLATVTAASSQTGSTWIDSLTLFGPDIQVEELGGGTVTVRADWSEKYA